MLASLIPIGTRIVPFLLQAVLPNTDAMTPDQRYQIALEAVKHQNRANDALALLVPYAVFAMVLGIVWLGTRQKKARLQMQAEFHKQLLDKFGSGREFADFLESPGSQRFIEGQWAKNAASKEGPLRNGIVMTM